MEQNVLFLQAELLYKLADLRAMCLQYRYSQLFTQWLKDTCALLCLLTARKLQRKYKCLHVMLQLK